MTDELQAPFRALKLPKKNNKPLLDACGHVRGGSSPTPHDLRGLGMHLRGIR